MNEFEREVALGDLNQLFDEELDAEIDYYDALTNEEVDAELRRCGIDPRPTIEAVTRLVTERVRGWYKRQQRLPAETEIRKQRKQAVIPLDGDIPATFVVFAEGQLGADIAALAEEHAAFAPECRRVVTCDRSVWVPASDIEAVVVDVEGVVCAALDARRGLSPAWIEDAFVRGTRRPRSGNV